MANAGGGKMLEVVIKTERWVGVGGGIISFFPFPFFLMCLQIFVPDFMKRVDDIINAASRKTFFRNMLPS